MFREVSEHYGGVRNVSESERNGSDHFWKVENHFRKVVLVIGRFRKIPEGSGSFSGFRKNHEWKGTQVGPTWQVGHAGPTCGLAELGGRERVLVGLQLPPQTELGREESH